MGARLLYVVTEDWYFCTHRLPLALAAQRAGYDVAVATNLAARRADIERAGLRAVPFTFARGSTNPASEVMTIARLASIYRRERPDLVHHVALKPVLYGTLAARLAGRPRVVNAVAGMGWLTQQGNVAARLVKAGVRALLGAVLRAGVVVVQNPDDEAALLTLGVPATRIHRFDGAGVDLEAFSPAPESPGPPVVILASRLLWPKGVGEFVEAARLLRERGVVARFVLAGEPDRANPGAVADNCIREWVRAGIVEYLGHVSDMPRVFADAHLVCLPSYYGEGIPKVLIEAAAAGRAIVTTDMPGCREIVREGENGLLVPPRDASALARALQSLLEDPARRRRMGETGRAFAESRFGLDVITRQTLALYAAALL